MASGGGWPGRPLTPAHLADLRSIDAAVWALLGDPSTGANAENVDRWTAPQIARALLWSEAVRARARYAGGTGGAGG